MATSFTPRLKLAKQDNADNIGAWEIPLNTGFDDADARFFRSGVVTPIGASSPDGDADYTGQRYYDTVTRLWYTAIVAGSPGIWIQSEVGQLANSVQSLKAGLASAIPAAGAATAGAIYIETDSKLIKRDNGTVYEVLSPTGAAGAALPFGYISGLGLANDVAGDTNFDIIVSGGACRSAANLVNIEQPIATPITKRLDAAWMAGTGNGGLFSGSIAGDTWYHVFTIVKDSDSTVDFGFDTSVIAANRDAGYTEYRRLGAIKTNADPIIYWFRQLGNHFNWFTPKDDVNLIEPAIGAFSVLSEMSAPLGVKTTVRTMWNLDRNSSAASTQLYVSDPDTLDHVPIQQSCSLDLDGFNVVHSSMVLDTRTNLLSEVRHRLNRAAVPATIIELDGRTTGYFDNRGQDGQGMV